MDAHLQVIGDLKARYIVSGFSSFLYVDGAVSFDKLFGYLVKNENKKSIIVTNHGQILMSKSDKLKKIEQNEIHELNIFIDEIFTKDEYSDDSKKLILNEDLLYQYLISDNNVLK